MTDPTIVAAERRGFLAALYYPQYRLLWISALASYIGRWIEMVVVAWLVLELTNSPLLVGLLGTCRFAGMLLGPFCGTIADRFNRRRILLAVQAVYAIASLIMMMLFLTSQLAVWHLFVFTFIAGLCSSFDFSTRYAAAAGIVKSHHLVTAVSLLAVAMGSTIILGALLGGSLLNLIQASGCFALVTACFLLSFLVLLPMKITAPARSTTQASMWENLADGLRYVKNDKTLLALILIAALLNLFLTPYRFTLLPVFARDVLQMGASGYGQLMAATGLGAVIGPLIAASLPNSVNKGKLLIASMIAWPTILMIFAASRLFPLTMLLLVFTGITHNLTMTLIQALLLVRSSEAMRGRVSGVRAFAIGIMPLGTLLSGGGANLWGAPTMLVINSLGYILISILITIWAPELRKRK